MGDPGDFGRGPGGEQAGEGRGTRLVERLEREIAGAGVEAAEAALRSLLDSPTLPDFLAEVTAYRRRAFPATVGRVTSVKIEDQAVRSRLGQVPIALLDSRRRGALELPPGAETRSAGLVRLSPETAVKQVINHGDLGVRHYRWLADLIANGEMLVQDERRLVFFGEFDAEGLFRAVVKQAPNNELYLATFHGAKPRDRVAARRKKSRPPE